MDKSCLQFLTLILDRNNKLFENIMDRLEFMVFCAILFDNIWLTRNSIVHGATTPLVNSLQALQSRSSVNQSWNPPPIGWFKINMDAAFKDGNACSGVVIRNANGSFVHAYSMEHKCLDANTAEALAILDSCLVAQKLGLQKVLFESDCLNVVSFINGNSRNYYWTSGPVVEAIDNLKLKMPLWSFSFVPRVCNSAAHALAAWAFCNDFFGNIPLVSIPVNVFCDFGSPLVDAL
ncbi:hypothetical protein CASFOL_012463 [Castilleja foliolosa]|uniref:RNase H type-1 domain-containing protein n=1 Tax=Castilleja foliolosa TaxID=1961234 RepID=A0ABD3DHC3_9LAMI